MRRDTAASGSVTTADVALVGMMVAVIEAIQAYEPRAKVESVEFEETTDNVMEGLLKPRVTVSIEEG